MGDSDWNQQAQSLWQSGEQQEAINAVIQTLNQHAEPKPKVPFLQLSYYLFLIGDYASVCSVLAEAMRFYPDDIDILTNRVVALSRHGLYKDAIVAGEQVLQHYPDNMTVLDALTKCYAKSQQFEQAVNAGNRSLQIKDQQYGQPTPGWSLPEQSIPTFVQNKKKVISFSLWGMEEAYTNGAIRNLLLANEFYPDWELWIYLDNSVSESFAKQLVELGAVLHHQPGQQTLLQKLGWRFRAANDPDVGYFLVRDIDSVFSIRERLAVEEWLNSGCWFHTIHDWWTHTDLMLAGLWGGVANVLPDLWDRVEQYQPAALATPNIDQWFLRDQIWSYVRQSLLIHDRCYRQQQALAIPGPAPIGNQHIGSCEFEQMPELQRRLVAPWARRFWAGGVSPL